MRTRRKKRGERIKAFAVACKDRSIHLSPGVYFGKSAALFVTEDRAEDGMALLVDTVAGRACGPHSIVELGEKKGR